MKQREDLKVKSNVKDQTPPKSTGLDKVLETLREWFSEAMKLQQPEVVGLDRGLEVSAKACSQPDDVPVTPFFRKMLQQYDHFAEGQQIKVNDKLTKAEEKIQEMIRTELEKNWGPESMVYDHTKDIFSKDHYIVDLWRNFKTDVKMRDIQPGMEEMRRKQVGAYVEQLDVEKFIRDILNWPELITAIKIVDRSLPNVKADDEFKQVEGMFQKKMTNVGMLRETVGWFNAKSKNKDGLTYAQLAMQEARTATPKTILNYNVSTAFGRNQRGKGRLLIAPSRVLNIFLDRQQRVEIEKLKHHDPTFSGYLPPDQLKVKLIELGKAAKRSGYVVANFDQAAWDQHTNLWPLFVGVLRHQKAVGALSKMLVKLRALTGAKTFLVNGMTGKVETIYGRVFSGELDTNTVDSYVIKIVTLAFVLTGDPSYLDFINRNAIYLIAMGDDVILALPPSVYHDQVIPKLAPRLGMEVNAEKGEFGIFYLQYRVYEEEGKYHMVYPWTRVMRSLCFKEQFKDIGPFGWLLSAYQSLDRLYENDKAFNFVGKWLIEHDDLRMGTSMTVKQLREGISKEDRERQREGRVSLYQALYDGDPTKENTYGNGEFSPDFITKIHSKLLTIKG